MDEATRRQIIEILDAHRIMTVATLRPDGWPQATTVGYGNDGTDIYFLCATDSQKAENLARDNRVSATINGDKDQMREIKGLSLAARAHRLTDEAEGRKAIDLLISRYPPQEGLDLEMPQPSDVALFRLEPVVVSVLDYSKGFAHSDLVSM